MTQHPRGRMSRFAPVLLPLAVASVLLAGDLNPPAPPGPTMKSLQAVEPRHTITASMLPLRITEAGTSWYLAENISTSGNGITIAADFVTIDLNGFTFQGGLGHGIATDQGTHTTYYGLAVKNGTIRNWQGGGIHFLDEAAVFYSGSYGTRIENVTTEYNGGGGIWIGEGSVLQGCVTHGNTNAGIKTSYAVITGCTAEFNNEQGFFITDSLIQGCKSRGNLGAGIQAGCSSLVVDNVVVGNWSDGINSSGDSVIRGNKVSFNKVDGIVVESDCVVENNSCVGQGYGIGIRVNNDRNRIENNEVSRNSRGIMVDGSNNIVVRNTAHQNTIAAFTLTPTNMVGEIVAGYGAITAGPWANFIVGP